VIGRILAARAISMSLFGLLLIPSVLQKVSILEEFMLLVYQMPA
jgi:hypothetical protein